MKNCGKPNQFRDSWWGHAVTQLAETLRWKSKGRGFDSRRCHCYFSLTKILQAALWPWG